MWYKIEYNRLGILLIPTFLRKQNMVAFAQALLRPIDTIYYWWSVWRADNIYKLEHTGQVCSLRKSLNDNFDPAFRRIYIGSGQEHEPIYIFTEAEEQDVWLENDPVWLYTDAETADSGLDFIVYVPKDVYENQIYELSAHTNFYKPGGKRYKITIIK